MQDFPHSLIAERIINANNELWRLDLTGFNMFVDKPSILRYKAEEKVIMTGILIMEMLLVIEKLVLAYNYLIHQNMMEDI